MKKLFTLLLGILGMHLAGAQDIHFSQFYENAILRNPALTGIFSGDYKAGLNYRTQWGNISNPFQTVMASAESRILLNRDLADYLSFGLCFSYDHAGAINFNSTQITPAINYNKSLNDSRNSYLSAGFAASYIQRSIDPTKMTLDEQYVGGTYVATAPGGETMNFSNIKHFDVSAGVSFNSTIGPHNNVVYYLGAAAFHATKPRESFNDNEYFIRLNPKYTANIGLQIRLSREYGLVLHANYTNQDPYQETIFGGLLSWRSTSNNARKLAIYAGCFGRLHDAVIPTLKLDYMKYSFTMSYDVTTSSLKPSLNSNGGYEFSLYVRGNYPKKANNVDQVRCPRFEQDNMSNDLDD